MTENEKEKNELESNDTAEILTPLDGSKKSKTAIIHQRFEGPIPPPKVLAQYEELSPGLANRIVAMAEQQGNHRRNLEATHLNAQIKHLERADWEAKLGQIFAFIIAMTAIIGGIFAIIHDYPYAGSFITTLGIGSIITASINGRFNTSDTKKTSKKNPTQPIQK